MQKWIETQVFDNTIILKGNKSARIKCNYQISRYGLISVIEDQFDNKVIGNGVRSRALGQFEGWVMMGNDSMVSWREKT